MRHDIVIEIKTILALAYRYDAYSRTPPSLSCLQYQA